MKRTTSFVLAVVVLWSSVTSPARAFAPVAVLAAPQIVTASGVGYALSAMAGVIGLTGLYMTIKDAQENAVRVPLGPNTRNEPPPPQAAATSSTVSIYNVNGQSYADYSTACDARIAYENSQQVEGNWGMGMGKNVYTRSGLCTATCQWVRTSDGYKSSCGTFSLSMMPTTGCPAGYSLVNGACTLQNARQAKDDKTCDLLVSGGQFATANDMNCPSTVDGTKLAPMLRDGKVVAYGQNSSGQPLMWEVSAGAQTYTVKQYEQVQTATQTQVKTTTATVDAATSTITSVQTQTSPGSMSSPSAATAPTVTTQADPATATNTPTVTQDQTKPADTITCGLPGTPACAIDDTQFQNKDNFSAPKVTQAGTDFDAVRNQLENSKDSLPTIGYDWLPSILPGNASMCSPIPLNIAVTHGPLAGFSHTENLDICDKLQVVRDILGYLLGVFTIFYVWRSFSRSNEGA